MSDKIVCLVPNCEKEANSKKVFCEEHYVSIMKPTPKLFNILK
jgi:hypothetical protein